MEVTATKEHIQISQDNVQLALTAFRSKHSSLLNILEDLFQTVRELEKLDSCYSV